MAKNLKKLPDLTTTPITPEAILNVFATGSKTKRFALSDLQLLFGNTGRRRRELELALTQLVGGGKLVRLKGPAFTLPNKLTQVQGYIKIQRQGMGFVHTNNGDIYIHPSQMGDAWDGDLVQVALLPGQSGKNAEGRVLEVLERSRKELMVQMLPQVVKEKGILKRLARPLDTRLHGYLLIDPGTLPKKLREGDILFAALEEVQQSDGVTRATAVADFSDSSAGKPVAMFERLVKTNHNIYTNFPKDVLAEAATLPENPNPEHELAPQNTLAAPLNPDSAKKAANSTQSDKTLADKAPVLARKDLRELELVTIDGADAKDFDDAICVIKHSSGFTLWVAIADVAHYVQPGSQLDAEALKRGNSAYFPASVEPMLPEALSNGLCSLKPNQPRLAMVAQIEFDSAAREQKTEFYPALIQSKARLTYEEVQTLLNANSNAFSTTSNTKAVTSESTPPPAGLEQHSSSRQSPPTANVLKHKAMLLAASELAALLIKKREARGTLAFDLPEPEVCLDKHGNITDLKARERLFSHKLIEEFMIAANEAVARFLATHTGINFLYRTHSAPDPDKLAELIKILQQNGLAANIASPPSINDLQKLLNSVAGTEQEFVVNRLMLRSLMQARYSPVAEGHFGLASTAYTHFTSPIRRYADLLVHRALKTALGFGGKNPSQATLLQIADDINNRERDAVEAEREIFKICSALFLQSRIGEEFKAVVSGLSSFGLFVELASPPAEGFIRIANLPDDYYELKPEQQMLIGQRSGVIFRMGQSLNVLLAESDPLRQEINFELAPGQGFARSRAKAGKQSTSRNSHSPSKPAKGKKAQYKKKKLPKGSVRKRT